MIKKLLSVLTILSIIIGLFSGCAETASQENVSQISDTSIRFSPEVHSLFTNKDVLTQAVLVNDTIMIVSKTEGNGHRVSSFSINGKTLSTFAELDTPWLGDVYATKDGVLHTFYYSEDGNITLVNIDAGQIFQSVFILPEALMDAYVMGIIVCGDSYLVHTSENIYVIDSVGSIIQEYGPYDAVAEIIVHDEGFYILSRAERSINVQNIGSDLIASSSWEIPGSYSDFYEGFPGTSDMICAYGSDIMYLLNIKTGERTTLSNLFSSGGSSKGFVCLSETSYFSFFDNSPTIWMPAPTGDLTTLTLATYSGIREEWDELLRQAVILFNAQSAEYRIEVLDYSTLNEYPDAETGKNRYRLDIITGNTPDIYDLWSIPSQNFVAQGVVENLYPYFEEDSSIPIELLVESVVSAAEYNGYLYEIIPSFDITSVFCSTDFAEIIAKSKTQNREDLYQNYNATSLFGTSMSRENFMLQTMVYSGSSFIDMKTASCSFDSEEFKRILEFSFDLPATAVWDVPPDSGVYSGLQQILISTTKDIVNEYQFANALFRGNAELIGFPTGTGSGITIAPRLRIGMSSSSENKDGVWEFMKFLLEDYFQGKAGGLCARKDLLESRIRAQIEATSTSEKRIAVYLFDKSGNSLFETIQLSPLPSGTEEKIWSYIDNADGINEYDNIVFSLVMREANKFYDGLCSADEASETIQKKVSLYLAEQYS